jgi:hypothetical protein
MKTAPAAAAIGAVVVAGLAAGGLACGGSAGKILERLDGSTPPSSNPRVDVFLVRSVSTCAVGPACASPDRDQCFHVADGSGARVPFDPVAVRFVPPGDPAAMGGAGQQVQCFRLVLDDGGVAAVGEATRGLRTRVFQDSGGDINLDVRLHEVPAVETAAVSVFTGGMFLEPAALAGAATPLVTRETDFVFAVTGAGDPASGLSPRIDSCSGTNWLAKGVIGASAYSWMVSSASCGQEASFLFAWIVQLYFGLRDVMQAPDLYDRDYPACGQGDPDPTRWFPFVEDCTTDPDYAGCGAATCADRDAFYRHMLVRHWRRGEPFNGNHCSDGRMDRDEAGVDTGGVCDQIGR